MALGKLDIIIAADTAQIRKDMGTAVNIMQSTTKQMESFAKNASAAIAGYFTVDFFKKQITQTLEFAESLNKLRQKTGMSADSLYSLNAAAELADVSYEDMSKSLTKFNKAIGETSAGTGESRKSFDHLGISIKNQDGTLKNSFDLLGEVADQFEKMPDGASKATIAMGLFGKSGTAMIPLLNEGKDSLRQYLGVMDNETGMAAERFNDSFIKMHLAMNVVYTKTLKDLVPSINFLSGNIEELSNESLKTSDVMSGGLSKGISTVVENLYSIAIVSKNVKTDIINLASNIEKLADQFNIASGDNGGLGLFKQSILGLQVILDTMYVGLHNSIVMMTELAVSGKNLFTGDQAKDFLTRVNEQILTSDDLLNKYINSYQLLLKSQKDFSNSKNENKSQEDSNKKSSDTGLKDENDLKKYNATLAAQIQGLEKQFGIRTQIENLNIEAALRNDAISKPEAEYLKEKNDILSQIAKNQETINLLSTKISLNKYDRNNENDKVADQQKVNDLLKENELQEKKLTAAEERKQATIKAGNLDLKNQMYALDLTETDKQYQSLADTVSNLIKEGRDLSLVGQFATKQADRIEIQKRLDSTQEMLNLQEGYIALLNDEDAKKIALTNLDSDRRVAEFEYLEKLTPSKAAYYQQEIENEEKLRQKTLEHLTTYGQVIDGVASDMTSSFQGFFDYTSDGFMKFGNLAKNILSEVYNEIIKIAVVKPLVSSLTTSAFSLFSTPSTASASTASSYSLGSGGSLTNSYFQAYDGGMIPFASGGYTGDGGKYEPKGVVHGGEYVMPAWMVQKNKPLVSALETTRIRGYSDGGSVGGNVGGSNIRVEIKNESSQSLEVTSATQTYDSEGAVLSIVINGIQKNKMGLRDMLGGK